MATEWFYKQSDKELGPYLFSELITMVGSEQILPETMVRPSYLDQWQRADSVPALFYMANRELETKTLTQPEEKSSGEEYADETDLDAFLAESNVFKSTAPGLTESQLNRPGWLRRLLSMRDCEIPPAPSCEIDNNLKSSVQTRNELVTNLELPENTLGDKEDVFDDAETGSYSDETWSATVNAAVDRIDARAPREKQATPSRIALPAINISFLEHPAFRKILAVCILILCVSLGCYGFVKWMGQGELYFPLIGHTSPLLFLAYAGCSLIVVLVLGPLLVCFAAPYVRIGYRLVATMVASNITILFLLNWSEKKNMIFPSQRPAEAKLIFPLVGECSGFIYWVCFVDSVAFVSIIVYFAAWWLEAKADEI